MPCSHAASRSIARVTATSSGRPSEPDAAYGTFAAGQPVWLDRMDNVRNVVRQEMITRQLARHLQQRPARVLDVGAGQGTQSIRLARAGHSVLAAEPSPEMRAQLRAALDEEPLEVRERVTLIDDAVGELGRALGTARFDAVLLLGVLMYLPSSPPVIAELASLVAPGGILAVATRTPTSAAWRPAARQDWQAALDALDEWHAAGREGRDVHYVNELGTAARADDVTTLVTLGAGAGLRLEQWYGVRVAVDLAEQDPRPPADPAELAALIEVEDRLGRIDPYRQLAQLAHVILRRPEA